VIKIGDSESVRNMIARNTCDKRRQQHIVKNTSDKKNLNTKKGPGNRGSKNRGKSGANTANHQFFSILVVKFEQIGKNGGKPSPDLGTGAFLSC